MDRQSLRRVMHLALGEGARTGGSFDKRTTLIILTMMLVTGLLTPVLLSGGLDFDRGLYRVSVMDGAPLAPAVLGSPLFRVVDTENTQAAFDALDRDEVDLVVLADAIHSRHTQKSAAAVAALRQAAKDHAYLRLAAEPDLDAAFPVRVTLQYETQQAGTPGAIGPPRTVPEPQPTPTPATTGGNGGTGVSGGGSGSSGSVSAVPPAPSSGFDFLPASRSINTPETLSPPFPFRSLLLAYAFLIPMNFVVQVYAGSAIGERLQRRGEALLASPARPWEIIIGKALPYFLLMMLISAGIVMWIGAGWLSLLAIAPLAYAFLALEFVSAMFARSFRELTFLTVFTSVLVTIYAFLPAVFSDVHPIALVSPITLVVFDLRGEGATLGQILYSTLPLTLFSTSLFMLGASLYREEDLFHQKPVLVKAVDAVARQVKGMASAIKTQIMFLPFVFVTELLLVTFLFAWPVPVGMLGVLVAVALVEETFKAAPSYAGISRGVIAPKRAILFGALVGLGFFLAEKGFLLASLVGLYDVPAANTIFGTAGGTSVAGGAGAWLMVGALLLGPLILHVVTAAISAWGAQKDRKTFAASFALAVTVHTAYNFTIVQLNGGGFLP